ncbi:hypothetical protein V6Z11_A11G196900 [Gossypium hirsutum]
MTFAIIYGRSWIGGGSSACFFTPFNVHGLALQQERELSLQLLFLFHHGFHRHRYLLPNPILHLGHPYPHHLLHCLHPIRDLCGFFSCVVYLLPQHFHFHLHPHHHHHHHHNYSGLFLFFSCEVYLFLFLYHCLCHLHLDCNYHHFLLLLLLLLLLHHHHHHHHHHHFLLLSQHG